MKWRNHGANPEKLYKQFNIEIPNDIIDFSTNTNIIEANIYLNFDLEKIISHYPDDESMELRQIISRKNNVDIDEVLITNGSNEAIYIIASLCKKAAILQPTYSEYERALRAYKKKIINIQSVYELEDDIDLLFICNPNNPTGGYIDVDELEKIAYECKKKSISLVIDEAYIDFLNADHHIIDIKKHSNVYLLRSMTKVYHMSGLRLGYVISSKDKIREIKLKQPSWSVNAIAQTIGAIYIMDDGFINKTKEYYQHETKRVMDELQGAGYAIQPTNVHYFLMHIDDDEKLIEYLLRNGIVVRHTRNFHGLDGSYVRICVREKDENDILIEKLKEYNTDKN